jgi:hypothetical protein
LEDDSQLTSKLLMNQIHIGEYQRMFTPKFCSKLIVVRWKVNQGKKEMFNPLSDASIPTV